MAERDDAGAGFLKCFGKQMKLFRELAGLTQPELAKRLNYGEDLVASVEQGRRIPKPEFIDVVDDVLNAHGVLKAMKDEVAQVRYPAFFRDAARLEAEAVEYHAYDCQVINGLLQTEEYARAVLAMRRPVLSDETIDQRVIARMARQQIFSRRPAPLMSFVVEEAVLRRPIGGVATLRGELEQLLLFGQNRSVEIQVMPTCQEDHAGLDGSLILMETAEQKRIGYLEVQEVSRLITDRKMARELEARYGIIRAQALTPRESLAFIEKLLGEV